MKTFYLVWNKNTGYTKYEHENIFNAENEAVRLARLNPGEEFHVLQALGKVKIDNTVWEKTNELKALENDIPF